MSLDASHAQLIVSKDGRNPAGQDQPSGSTTMVAGKWSSSNTLSGQLFLYFSFALLAMAMLASAATRMPAAKPPSPRTVAYANQLLDSLFSPEGGRKVMEASTDYEGRAKALVELGQIGWDETFKRLEGGSYHDAFITVLGRGSPWVDKEKCTARLMGLLDSKTYIHRKWLLRIIAAREPIKGNQLLLRFLADPDPEVREFCVVALEPLVAAPPEIEAVIGLMDDPSHPVRSQSRSFLERATGHVTRGEPEPGDAKTAWLEWWQAQQPADMAAIVKSELTRCADLLTDPDEEFREHAGMPLVIQSAQTYFGFHQKNVWWGVHNGEHSKASWKEWLRLRYSMMESAKTTTWEYEFHKRRPGIPLAALRATIAMNVGDLKSESSAVRSLARESIASLLQDACPFRVSYDDRENEWLNEGVTLWWAKRIKSLGE
jgi:hypothetical protein